MSNQDYDPVALREYAVAVIDEYATRTDPPMTNMEHMEAILTPILAEVWEEGRSAESRYRGGSYDEFNPYVKDV